jgi:hypothetical protein
MAPTPDRVSINRGNGVMRLLLGLFSLVCMAGPAFADPPPAQDSVPTDFPILQPDILSILLDEVISAEAEDWTEVQAPVVRDGDVEAGEALDPASLAELRGGETVVIQSTNQSLNATNNGNSVTGDTVDSGSLTLGSNAFTGFNGIGNFVVNTGHNNNLQGSISVSIVTTPQ